MKSLLIANAEVSGRPAMDVRIRDGRIHQLGSGLDPEPEEVRLDARGGALLPGLRDHHIHLLSMAAALDSVPCGPPTISTRDALAGQLRRAGATSAKGWIRGVGYHESVAGELDRWQLDAWVPNRPLRIQHRSGALWMLNSTALATLELGRGDPPAGVERDQQGRITGRLFRLDGWLRRRLGQQRRPSLERVGQMLARCGVTGVCDTSAHNGAPEMQHLADAVARGELRQRLLVMGGHDLPESTYDGVTRGHVKMMLTEDQLPAIETLATTIVEAHAQGRGVAIHCLTRAELVVAVTALSQAGCLPQDRIEHASVTPPDLIALLRALPVTIVGQPNFILERGDTYLEEVDSRDRPWLYRGRGFLEAGLRLAAGTDAPFGAPDPWRAMRAAVERRSASGLVLGQTEALSPEEALALFTGPLSTPGNPLLGLQCGDAADLCLLDRPWSRARNELDAGAVRTTICGGEVVFDSTGGDGSG